MLIIFANRKLKKYANDFALAKKKLGNDKAEKYHQRIEDIRDAENFNDLQSLPGDFHALHSNRQGQWSCHLDHSYRLIFAPAVTPIPTNEHGTPILTEIRRVNIIEIIDYH